MPVPTGATTGTVVVTVGGVASNGVSFTVGVPPPSPITLTQHAGLNTGGTSAALAFPANNVAGNFIVVAARARFANQTFTVSDTRSNVYRRALTVNNGTDDTLAIFYAENIAAGANTVTVGVSTGPASIRLAILEYAGIARANALDVHRDRGGVEHVTEPAGRRPRRPRATSCSASSRRRAAARSRPAAATRSAKRCPPRRPRT